MARIRTIKPAFFMDEDLADVTPLGRLLFIGLWCLADCAGRLKDSPKRVKAEVLPYDTCDVDAELQKLHDQGFIIRYEIDSIKFIQVVNFLKHQRITGKEAEQESEIPGPKNIGETTGKQQGNIGETVETTGREGKGRERKGKEGKGVSPDSLRLSGMLADLILIHTPNHRELRNGTKATTIQRWADDIDRMMRLDGPDRTPDAIEKRIVFATRDSFWYKNILSGSTLRKQFDRLGMEMSKPGRKQHNKHAGIDEWLKETYQEGDPHGA